MVSSAVSRDPTTWLWTREIKLWLWIRRALLTVSEVWLQEFQQLFEYLWLKVLYPSSKNLSSDRGNRKLVNLVGICVGEIEP